MKRFSHLLVIILTFSFAIVSVAVAESEIQNDDVTVAETEIEISDDDFREEEEEDVIVEEDDKAGKKKKEIPVQCNADSVSYNRESNTIKGKGNVEVVYMDNYLYADIVDVSVATKEVWAKGKVIISDGENIFTGDEVYYDFETGKGTIDGISSRLDPWFARGKQGERIPEEVALVEKKADSGTGDKKTLSEKPAGHRANAVYYIQDGYITTCDYDKPHYRLHARHIYIYPGDKIILKDIKIYVGNLPVFYWPYYNKSLKDERSPWSIVPGNDNKFGYYLLTGYSMYWDNFFGGIFKPTARLDWYEKRGVGLGMDARYSKSDIIRSIIRAYYINDKAREIKTKDALGNEIKETREEKRGRLSIDYAQRFGAGIRGLASLNYQSDKDFLFDFYRDEFQDEVQKKNYINLSKTSSRYQLSLMTQKRFQGFYTDLEKLPEVKLTLLKFRLGKTRFLYNMYASAGYLRQVYAHDVQKNDYAAMQLDTKHQLSYPKKYFGWLNFVPRIGTRQTYYNKKKRIDPITSRVEEVDEGALRSVYFTGAEFSTKISRIFDVNNDFWEVNMLRHLIEPRINYTYQHEPTVPPKDLLKFGTVETQKNYFALSLRNKLQTKRSEEAWNLVDFNLSTNFYTDKYDEVNYVIEEQMIGDVLTPVQVPVYEKRSFSYILGRLQLKPFDFLEMDNHLTYDQYDTQVNVYNTELVFYNNDLFSFGMGFRYARGLTKDSKLWTSEINYTLNSNWALRMCHRFDFETGDLQEQEYILFRDLHCWKGALSYRSFRDIDEQRLFVVLYPKAYPEFPISFGTKYFGSGSTAEIDFDADAG